MRDRNKRALQVVGITEGAICPLACRQTNTDGSRILLEWSLKIKN